MMANRTRGVVAVMLVVFFLRWSVGVVDVKTRGDKRGDSSSLMAGNDGAERERSLRASHLITSRSEVTANGQHGAESRALGHEHDQQCSP